jgi:hypothetical protein
MFCWSRVHVVRHMQHAGTLRETYTHTALRRTHSLPLSTQNTPLRALTRHRPLQLACAYCCFMPLYESWDDLMHVTYGLCGMGTYKSTTMRFEEMEARLTMLEGGVSKPPMDPVAAKEAALTA